jgi:hypothetical protein
MRDPVQRAVIERRLKCRRIMLRRGCSWADVQRLEEEWGRAGRLEVERDRLLAEER